MSPFLVGVMLSLVPLDTPTPPVSGAVVEHFRAPTCLRCAGRRGVVIASAPASEVRAVQPGTVSYAGQVAHRLYVVIDLAPTVKVTYGWLDAAVVSKGQSVHRGDPIGRAGSRTYLGVRIGGRYVEPLGYLGLRPGRLTGAGTISRVR